MYFMSISVTRNILKIIVIFILGVGGGIFADQILWPYFVEKPFFYEYRLDQAPVYITENNDVTVTENIALQSVFEQVEKSLVAVRTITSQGKIIIGSGLIVTSDGLIITLADLVPQGERFAFFVGGEAPNWQVLKRDLKNNLVLVKLEKEGLPTIGFAEYGSLRFGQRVFLAGATLNNGDLKKVVNEGIIKTYNNQIIETNILENNNISGSPLFNIKGELAGLSVINAQGQVSAVPINIVREFIGF